ncbi:MAG: hypothetical protein JXR58_01575 [Bacteroidales bacterium]|nr:hypothetical protein [Bacteroidales bacterium]
MKIFILFTLIVSCLLVNAQEISIDSLFGKNLVAADTIMASAFSEKPVNSSFPEFHSEYLCYKKSGVELLFEKDSLTTIFVYLFEKDGYSVYEKGLEMPEKSLELKTRKEVIKKMGEPDSSNEEFSNYLWDKYNMGKIFLHFEYDEKGNTRMITIMLNKKYKE